MGGGHSILFITESWNTPCSGFGRICWIRELDYFFSTLLDPLSLEPVYSHWQFNTKQTNQKEFGGQLQLPRQQELDDDYPHSL